MRHLPLWKPSPLVNQWSCLLDNLSSIYQLLYLMDLYLYVCLFTCLFNFLSFLLCCLKKKNQPPFVDYLEMNSEKAMAPHSRTLAWKIPWTEEPGGLQSMGSWRVGHDWTTSLSLFTFMLWRRKWQPTPVFLPGESQGQESLVGCHLWGRTESDMTEVT